MSTVSSVPRVDFSHAFAPPHRITVAPPDSGDKTLVDCEPGLVSLSWSYDTLLDFSVANFHGPLTQWKLDFQAVIDGRKVEQNTWRRLDDWLPGLAAAFIHPAVRTTIEVIGAQRAAIMRVEFTNLDRQAAHRATLECSVPGNWRGVLPAFVDPGLAQNARDALVAGWMARADRVIIAALGGEEYPLSANTLAPTVTLAPGETKVVWFIRPYRVYESMLPELRRRDWAAAFVEAKAGWQKLIARTPRLHLADAGVRHAYYAGLADIFIMREPVPGEYLGTLPGTELYRSANPTEAAIACVALDQAGLPVEAADGYRLALDLQNYDGCWSEPQGWARTGWLAAGFKSWFIMEHYRITRDRDFLANIFPRMLASSRWQERARQRSRILVDGAKPLNYGLLPPGMGDCGLKNDTSNYGVFLPHNFWAVYADQLTCEAAEILGLQAEAAEVRAIHETARADLLDTVRRGAINADGFAWIPGVAGKTSGSRWGALNAAYPFRLLDPHDPLIDGTIRQIESKMSPGGIPMHTGWMEEGMWVAITLDNLAETLLLRGEGDAVARYLYATLNHATPLYSWSEERGPEPGAAKVIGDRQHLWTPIAVVRLLRDSLVFEDRDTLHLARGADRSWLTGGPLGGDGFATHFGRVSYRLALAAPDRVNGRVTLDPARRPSRLCIHLRLPPGRTVTGVDLPAAVVTHGGTVLELTDPPAVLEFNATLG
ncbi:MAG: hypothetical protein KF897_12395 [Opitutaceae bacterium]|nr:hypothetical protein [Opitutaceae bacterium]